MEIDKDFTVTLLSNGSKKYFSDNSLTSFRNQLPQEILLCKQKDWYLSLQDIGIDLNYGNFAIPKDSPLLFTFDPTGITSEIESGFETVTDIKFLAPNVLSLCGHPSTPLPKPQIKITTDRSCSHMNIDSLKVKHQLFTIELISQKIKDFISNSNLLRNKLLFHLGSSYIKDIQRYAEKGSEIDIKGLKDFAILNPSVDTVKIHKTYFQNISDSETTSIAIGIHSVLYEALQFGIKQKANRVSIDNQHYYIIILKPKDKISSPLVLGEVFPKLASNVCHVYCDIIEPYHFNDDHCQIIRTISLSRFNKYYFNSFQTPQYFKIGNNNIKQICVKLLTESFESLPLLPGTASILKVHFKAMDQPKVTSLKVSSNSEKYSMFNNKSNNFRVKIPPNLSFDKANLHMAVSSITFPNKFKTLPNDDDKYVHVLTLNRGLKIPGVKIISAPRQFCVE